MTKAKYGKNGITVSLEHYISNTLAPNAVSTNYGEMAEGDDVIMLQDKLANITDVFGRLMSVLSDKDLISNEEIVFILDDKNLELTK